MILPNIIEDKCPETCREAAPTAAVCPPQLVDNAVALHGHGPPAADLGSPGDTYVDDDANALYWRSITGWFP